MNKKVLLLLSTIVALTVRVQSQEKLVSLQTLPVKTVMHLKAASATQQYLSLPFFDDFSQTSSLPDQSKWSDYYVLINNTYSVNPPSIGVATFDAIDNSTGNLYEYQAGSFYADKLTSLPFDFSSYTVADKLALSFYYQPQGNGDAPEATDSLLLQFYAPSQKVWNAVWQVPGSSLTNFKQVLIPITDTAYLQGGFQFRFVNKISYLSSNDNPGQKGNCDHWNVDYVYLNKNRSANDTIHKDIAINAPLQTMLKNYSAMPWKHFNGNTPALDELSDVVKLSIHNNYNLDKSLNRYYYMRETLSNISFPKFGGVLNIKADSTVSLKDDRMVSFESNNADSAIFEMKAVLTTEPSDYKGNDTAYYYQVFKNYYAYDDGSAENGYGLSGQGTQYGKLAYQFPLYLEDTIRAVDMYFNKALDNANQATFYLTVWKDDNGQPGDIILQQKGEKPEYTNLNKFYRYTFDSPLVLQSGTYYVGWVQVSTTFLNVGFDVNHNSGSRIFYNIDGTWNKSIYSGSLMVRPVFGSAKDVSTPTPIDPPATVSGITLYPNPAHDYCLINTDGKTLTSVEVYDLTGRRQSVNYTSDGTVTTSSLQSGIYLLRAVAGVQTATFRLVVIH
jgi:hypothetical protein